MHLQNNTSIDSGQLHISSKEMTLLYEIGFNLIPTATDFVEYIADKIGVSQSGVWYTLKKLKKERLVDFMEKGEEPKPLGLTELGTKVIRSGTVNVQNKHHKAVIGPMKA